MKAVSAHQRGMSSTRRWLVPLAAALLLWPACGSDDDESSSDDTTRSTTTTTAASVRTATTGASETTDTTGPEGSDSTPPPRPEFLVELVTSGGLDGQGIGGLVVSGAGELRYTGRDSTTQQGSLTSDELDELAGLLAAVDFAAVPAEPEVDDVCSDVINYTLTYQRWQVTADTCTIPSELAPVVGLLEAFMGRFA